VLQLSRRERGKLRTYLKKWNHHRGYDGHWGREPRKESFRTLSEHSW
jgi:hypothetical protein